MTRISPLRQSEIDRVGEFVYINTIYPQTHARSNPVKCGQLHVNSGQLPVKLHVNFLDEIVNKIRMRYEQSKSVTNPSTGAATRRNHCSYARTEGPWKNYSTPILAPRWCVAFYLCEHGLFFDRNKNQNGKYEFPDLTQIDFALPFFL